MTSSPSEDRERPPTPSSLSWLLVSLSGPPSSVSFEPLEVRGSVFSFSSSACHRDWLHDGYLPGLFVELKLMEATGGRKPGFFQPLSTLRPHWDRTPGLQILPLIPFTPQVGVLQMFAEHITNAKHWGSLKVGSSQEAMFISFNC